jgi:hypothetical protein
MSRGKGGIFAVFSESPQTGSVAHSIPGPVNYHTYGYLIIKVSELHEKIRNSEEKRVFIRDGSWQNLVQG